MHRDLGSVRPFLKTASLATALLLGIAGTIVIRAAAQERAAPAYSADLIANLRLRNIGPANMSGRVVDIAVVESDPHTFYVASATGGLWKTMDNGVTFTPLFQDQSVHSIGCLAISQAQPDIIWLGSGEATNRQSVGWGDGVYKSVDGGKSWSNMGLRDTKHIARIALHPTNPDVVFVAAGGHLWGPNRERGLFKSTDGGRTWRNVLFVDEHTGLTDVQIDPSDPKIMYAASYQRRRSAFGFHGGGPGSGLHASVDGGETWHKIENGLPGGDKGRIGISIYRKDPRILYVSIEQGLRYNASTAYIQRQAGIYRSENRGDSWTHMSDWNPRPMYASQIRVDPSDDRRVYMMNAFSFSNDSGKTFTVPPQTLHGDDRVVWINPHDSRHLIKGDDGGVGISYDRGLKWLYVTSLPISQFYRVSVDMQKPFWVYGGLQDNGSWGGPSANYSSAGILNEEWRRVGGGDGFFNVIDTTDNRTLYTSSQFLGLSRFDMVSGERKEIRPDNRRGFIQDRRNWETWGKAGIDIPELGNAMPPANWDAPIIISPHDNRTIYAGTNVLWKSTDRGESWTSLGDRTTGVDRSTLTLMGQTPAQTTLSLDDGVPYYPTLTAIAESPLRRGWLYVGTDDGNLQLSRDEGRTWRNVSTRVPGLPPNSWVADIAPSRHDENTIFVAFDNHRSDDYRNHVFKSSDFGETWTSIAGNLPPDRVVRAIGDDPKNRSLLYVATEFGFYFSPDAGSRWVEVKNNLPRVAVNDFTIHPRDNDLVLATHGRGIWILDNLSSLQELTPDVLSSAAHLFSIEPAQMIRYANQTAHAGDMIFRGENPPDGAIVDYYLAGSSNNVRLTVHDSAGRQVVALMPATQPGLNRVVWDLRHSALPGDRPASGGGDGRRQDPVPGPLVVPGTYTVRLAVGNRQSEQTVLVEEDPRINVSPTERRLWTEALLEVAGMFREATSMVTAVAQRRSRSTNGSREIAELARVTRELQTRLRTLYDSMSSAAGPPTSEQRAQMEYFNSLVRVYDARVKAFR